MFERESAARPLICLTGAWSALQPVPEGATTVVVAPSHPLPLATSALENARDSCETRAGKSPVFILRSNPEARFSCCSLPRPLQATPCPRRLDVLDGVYPELPGGLRVELTPDMTTIDVTRYAAILEQIISQEA